MQMKMSEIHSPATRGGRFDGGSSYCGDGWPMSALPDFFLRLVSNVGPYAFFLLSCGARWPMSTRTLLRLDRD